MIRFQKGRRRPAGRRLCEQHVFCGDCYADSFSATYSSVARRERGGLEDRALLLHNHLVGDGAGLDVVARRDLVHDVEQGFLDDAAQAARAGLLGEGLHSGLLQGIRREDQFDLVEVEELLVLLDDRVLGFGQDSDHRVFVERLEPHDDR